MVKILRLKSRDKICGNKVSFTHIKKAIDVAEKHNKNVYECPCCFCFHLTSRDNWKEEFVSFELFDKMRIEYAETKNHLDGAKKKIEAQATQLNQMQKSFEELRNKKMVYCQ